MTITIQDLINAADTSAGKISYLRGYVDRRGIKSEFVELRLGVTYRFQLLSATIKLGQVSESDLEERFDATRSEVLQAIDEQGASWQKSLDGQQPPRKDDSIPFGHTKRGVKVASIGKDGDSIIIHSVKKHVAYDRTTLPPKSERKVSKNPVVRVKGYLQSFISQRQYTLRVDNFDKLAIQGLILTPDDIASMLNEYRQTA